jgi:hypothetical protein
MDFVDSDGLRREKRNPKGNGRPGGPPNSLSNPNEQFGTTHFGLEASANIGPISISLAGQIILDRKGVHLYGSDLGGIIGIVKAEDKKEAKAKTKPISIGGGFFFAGTNAKDFDEYYNSPADEYGGSLGPVSVRALAGNEYEGFLVGMGIYGPNLQLGAGSGTLWEAIKDKVENSVKSALGKSKSIE